MDEWLDRTKMLLGEESIRRLSAAKVAIFGIGGVGGYVAETLARSGVGSFVLVDSDVICKSNINRQIIATTKTLGRYKAEVMKERILEINPDADVELHICFYLPETAGQFDFHQYSYVVDAVDTVTAKLELISRAERSHTPVISSMGTGNKLDPACFAVADIYETSVCPLARVMRRELKKRGIEKLKVVYSKEEPLKPMKQPDAMATGSGKTGYPDRRQVPGSVAFVPSAAGLVIAGEVVKDLIKPNG